MPKTNIEMLQIVAEGLNSLIGEMVFVGGAVAELYADNPAASDIRPTTDIDCVIELSSRKDHAKLENELRQRTFMNDTSKDAPICRWVYRGIKVDVMPTDSDILGFTNKWYAEGIENRIQKTLPGGQEINIFSPAYYLASKFDAHKGRGGTDLRQSQDFEDIIYVIYNCTNLYENIANANLSVKTYLINECKALIKNNNINEGIESAMPYDADSDSSEIVTDLIEKIANLEL